MSMPSTFSDELARLYRENAELKERMIAPASEPISAKVDLASIAYNPALTRILRDATGWSRARLGKELDVTDRQVYNYESGESNPPLHTIAKLYALFGQTDLPTFPLFKDQSGKTLDFPIQSSLEEKIN